MTEQNELCLRGAIISFESKSLTLLHSDDTLTTYTLTEDLRIRVQRARQAPEQMAPTASERVENPAPEPQPPITPVESQRAETEAKKTVTLTGVVKGALRPGRPDARGGATVWCRFAAHVEGETESHMYSTTFHRHAAKLAEQHLRDGAQATVEAYERKSDDPSRMDSLSVFHLVNYPGKQASGSGSGGQA